MIAAVLLAAMAIPVIQGPGAPPQGYEKLPPPTIQMRMNQASATTVPWIESNAWRYRRGVFKALYPNLPPGSAALAAAEAHAWGAEAVIEPSEQDRAKLDAMLAFIRSIDAPPLPPLANIGLVDDGSSDLSEVMNLLSRRNLLYKIVPQPDPALDLNIRIGSAQYPREAIRNPNDFAARVREQLSDEARLVRLFGTYTVLANLTGQQGRARLHLVNYSKDPVADVRVRVRGTFPRIRLSECHDPSLTAKDVLVSDGATEFTVPQLATYAVVDLDSK